MTAVVVVHALTLSITKDPGDRSAIFQTLMASSFVFVAPSILTGVVALNLRPFLGYLTQSNANAQDNSTILWIFVSTSLVACVLSTFLYAAFFGLAINTVETLTFVLICAALGIACLWTALAERWRWIGLFPLFSAVALGTFAAPDLVVSQVGHGFVVTYLIAIAVLLYIAFSIVRVHGYRLKRYAGQSFAR